MKRGGSNHYGTTSLSRGCPRQMTTHGHPALTESESEVAQPCPTLCDPTDCSLPRPFVHGICQARVLEWGAIYGKRPQMMIQVTVYHVLARCQTLASQAFSLILTALLRSKQNS